MIHSYKVSVPGKVYARNSVKYDPLFRELRQLALSIKDTCSTHRDDNRILVHRYEYEFLAEDVLYLRLRHSLFDMVCKKLLTER